MRTANLVVTALGLWATGVAAWIAWRWRALPIHPLGRPVEGWRGEALDATRTFAATITAGATAGLLVLGFGGRLVMRVLAATSGDGVQGRLTEADERIGAITTDGTIGFLTFIGLGGGVITAFVYLPLRTLLPDHAGRAGLIAAVIATGTLGVADPLSPDNVDFALLSPLPLAVLLLIFTALLFTTTFTALAAKFEQVSSSSAPLPRRVATMAMLPPALVVPPVTAGFAVYVGVRSGWRRAAIPVSERRLTQIAARTAVTLALVVTAALSTRAVAQIL